MAEQQRTDFGDLVRDRRAALAISLRELEKRSVDPVTGEQAKFGWINKVEKGLPIDVPTPIQIRALAAGLSLPRRTVQEAVAAQFLEMEPESVSEVWSEDRRTRLLVARLGEMSEEERAQVAELAEMSDEQRAQLIAFAQTFSRSRDGQ
ncbi:XRE family transcriptional regulator [Streptomyces hebeiensis]